MNAKTITTRLLAFWFFLNFVVLLWWAENSASVAIESAREREQAVSFDSLNGMVVGTCEGFHPLLSAVPLLSIGDAAGQHGIGYAILVWLISSAAMAMAAIGLWRLRSWGSAAALVLCFLSAAAALLTLYPPRYCSVSMEPILFFRVRSLSVLLYAVIGIVLARRLSNVRHVVNPV